MNWRPKGKKAQSAMEYLMTYGWAILIIAVVLGALFSLGVFSSSSFLGTACIPQSGYLCSNPVATPSGLVVTLGQATGSSWSNVCFDFVATGTTVPTSCTSGAGVSEGSPSGISLNSGQTQQITFPLPTTVVASNSIGAGISGTIWAYYTQGTTSGLQTEIGTITAKIS